jgi:CheY-like chemotaxis protein
MLAAMLGSDIAFMGELMIWLLAAAVLGLLAGGLLWRRRAEAEREAQRRAEEAAQAQRLTAERAEAERAAAAEREARRQAQLLAEQQRQAAQAQRRAAEQAETRRLAEQRAEQQRLAAAQAEAEAERERVAAAEREMRRQAERLAEQRRLAAELAERERIVAAEKAEEAERAAQRLAAERAAPPPRLAAKSAAQTLVLVADDSKVVRIKTGRLLAQHHYQVSYASDGLDAVQQLQANPPDLVITDVEMPGMDGFELTRHIRGNPQTAQLPVIMITAADDRHREQAEAAGVSVLLGKPYPEDALIAQIRLAMGQDEAETSPA